MNVLFYICSLLLHWVLDFKGFTSPLGTDLPVCDSWIMEQVIWYHCTLTKWAGGFWPIFRRPKSTSLLISRGFFGRLPVSWGLTVTSEKNRSLRLEILMQTVQFSPSLLFLGHSVRVVQYKLVEQIKKVDLMSVPRGWGAYWHWWQILTQYGPKSFSMCFLLAFP